MKGKKKHLLFAQMTCLVSCGPNFVDTAFLDISTKNLKE